MPNSATSAAAFYAASKQAANNSQLFSNYQLQNMSKQKQHLMQKQGSGSYSTNASQPAELSKLNTANPLQGVTLQ
mgnify:CR=1 FL=1